MTKITEKEAARLAEECENTVFTTDPKKPGVFARQTEMTVVLDEFSSRYLLQKTKATKKTPTEIISEMVRNEIAAV